MHFIKKHRVWCEMAEIKVCDLLSPTSALGVYLEP